MTNNIELQKELQKLKNRYPDFFKQISPSLLKFIFSEETSSRIAMICLESGVEDEEKIEKIAYHVTLVLLEQIAEENLTEILEKEVKLDNETAKKISIEIKLRILSKIQSEKIQKKENRIEKNQSTQPTKPLLPVEEEGSKKSSKEDTYREPIE